MRAGVPDIEDVFAVGERLLLAGARGEVVLGLPEADLGEPLPTEGDPGLLPPVRGDGKLPAAP